LSTVAALLHEASAALAAAGVDRPRAEARLFLEAATSTSRTRLLAHPEQPVENGDTERFRGWIARRATREPAAYIRGRVEFWSLTFRVGPGVLVPRADSETMIEAIIRAFPDRAAPLRVLDLGVGSGCLLLSVLHHFVNASGLGVDSSEQALAHARANAEALGLDARADLRLLDWRDGVPGTFDIVLANPPYIPSTEIDTLAPEVREFEPRAALDGGADGLDAYRTILPVLPGLLNRSGRAFLEVGAGQMPAVAALPVPGLGGMRFHHDLAGIARCLELWLGSD
jgi:release factor glutamine methyltransferase